jgi:hypothetical protein
MNVTLHTQIRNGRKRRSLLFLFGAGQPSTWIAWRYRTAVPRRQIDPICTPHRLSDVYEPLPRLGGLELEEADVHLENTVLVLLDYLPGQWYQRPLSGCVGKLPRPLVVLLAVCSGERDIDDETIELAHTYCCW